MSNNLKTASQATLHFNINNKAYSKANELKSKKNGTYSLICSPTSTQKGNMEIIR